MPKVISKAQARLFGLIAGGEKPTKVKTKGLSPEEAREMLRGAKIKGLPKKVDKVGKSKKIKIFKGRKK